MTFDYFYGSAADQHSFFRIPKCLMRDEYASLSVQAKLLYGLLLDRMGLSMHNKWIDEENRVFVIYQIAEIQADLNISRRKAIECLNELEACGLVMKRTRGYGMPNLLYPSNFMTMQPA